MSGEFERLYRPPRGVSYVRRREDLLAITDRNRTEAELLDALIVKVGRGLDSASAREGEQHRALQEEILLGEHPERAEVDFPGVAELVAHVGLDRKTIGNGLARLRERGLVRRAKERGATASDPFVYIPCAGRIHAALVTFDERRKGKSKRSFEVIEGVGANSPTGLGELPNRTGNAPHPVGENSADPVGEFPRLGGKTPDPLYSSKKSKTTGEGERLPPLPLEGEARVGRRALQDSQLPQALRGIDLTCLDLEDESYRAAVETTRGWVEAARVPLVLAGPPGTGKTTLAAAAAWAVLANGLPLVWVAASEATRLIEQGDFKDEARRRLLATFGERCGLAIDDLDARVGARAISELGAAITERLLAEIPVLITTDLAAGELEELLGEKTYSRLIAVGSYVELQGPNLHKLRSAA